MNFNRNRGYFSFLLLCFGLFQAVAEANMPNVNVPMLEKDGDVLPGSSYFVPIYEVMLTQYGFQNAVGHTMAAQVLSLCRQQDPDYTTKIKDMFQIMQAMTRSRMGTIAQGANHGLSLPQISYAAATLACKMGLRTPMDMALQLDKVYAGLRGDQVIDALYNIVTAAGMVR